jgi:PAS domain S-box-containing protein
LGRESQFNEKKLKTSYYRIDTMSHIVLKSNKRPFNLWRVSFLFVIIIFILFGEDAKSQHSFQSVIDERTLNEEWRWIQFTIESGLPSNHIISIQETKEGTVWVATTKGVARYDGFRWYKIDSTMGLPTGIPQSLIVAPSQIVYVLYDDGKIYCGGLNRFNRMFHDSLNIQRFVIDVDNRIFFSTHHKTYVWDFRNIDSVKLPNVPRIYHVSNSLWQGSQDVWFNTSEGLYKSSDNKWCKRIRSKKYQYFINSLAEDKQSSGVVSIGLPFEDRGVWEWSKNGRIVKNKTFQADWVTTMDINSYGDVIAVEKTGDILLRKKNNWSRLLIIPNKMRDVEKVKFRDNGDLWVGTKRGLFLFRQYSMYWEQKQNRLNSKNRVHDIIRSIDGTLWLATADGVEKHFLDGSSEIITHINNKPLYEVTAISEDKQGRIWIGSGSGFDGTYCWDGSVWKYEPIDANIKWLKIHRIKKDRKGNLWFLGLSQSTNRPYDHGPGAFRFDGKKFIRWSVSDGLVSGRVYAFCEDDVGRYWFGTQNGLSSYHNGSWKHWMCPKDIPFSKIFTMSIDKNNSVWFSDRTTGLGCLDTTGAIKYYKIEDGLPNNNIWETKVDSKGRLWVTSESGLGCYDSGRWKIYDIRTGLLTNDLWPIYIEGDSIFVGTQGKGLAILNLRRCHQPTPKIFIDQPLIEDNQAFIKINPFSFWGEIEPREILIRYSLDTLSWSSWNYQREFKFKDVNPGIHSIKIQAQNLFGEYDPQPTFASFIIQRPFILRPIFLIPVSVLSLASIILIVLVVTRRIRHKQMLTRSEAKFRRLAEATIEGVVIHSNGDIADANKSMSRIFKYSDTEILNKSLFDLFQKEYHDLIRSQITIPTSDYFEVIGLAKTGEKIWVEMVSMVLPKSKPQISVAAIRDITDRKNSEGKLIIYQNQLRKLVSELVLTEERERKRMAEFLHDSIGQALAYCKIKLAPYQVGNVSTDREKSLSEVRTLIDEAITNTRSLTYDLSPSVLYELGLVPAIESLAEKVGKRHNIEVSVFDNHRDIQLNQEENIIVYQTIRELFANTVKHAHARRIEIFIGEKGQSLEIQFSDDGMGFDPNKVAGGNGFGIFNIKEKLINIGARFDIYSGHSCGTKIFIHIPTNKPELNN